MRKIVLLATVATGIVLTAFLALVPSGWGRRADVAGGNGVPDVRMDQTSYSAAAGGTFHVLINVTGLGVVNCSHYQFGLTYDNTLVNIIASTPDEETGCVCGLYKRGFSWYYGDPLYGAGVDCGEVGVGTPTPASPPFTDPQQVVDFTFQCLRDGNGLLAFGDIVLYDGAGNPAYVVNTGADVLCGAGEPTATDTPVPSDTPTLTSTPSPTTTPTSTNTPNPTSTQTATPTPYADIDKIPDGDGWCDPVQAASTETVGDSHKLAVCVHNMPGAVGGFRLTIAYDDELDGCTEVPCGGVECVDDNPDADAGLGDEWDCDIYGEPVCHQQLSSGVQAGAGDGRATISCTGEDVNLTSGALAVLDLDVLAAGTDNVGINWLVVYNLAGDPIAHCQYNDDAGGFGMTCLGATDIKQSGETHKRKTSTPTPKPPTATPVPPTVPPPPPPPPTATPVGGVGPEITAPATGSGSPAGGFTWAIWLAAGSAGVAAAGGFYFRYAKKAR